MLAYHPAEIKVGYALIAMGRLTNHMRPRHPRRAAGTAMASRAAILICDHASNALFVQADDWHDLTGHHRYYGHSAYWDARQMRPLSGRSSEATSPAGPSLEIPIAGWRGHCRFSRRRDKNGVVVPSGRTVMNRLGMILLAAAVFAATTTPSEARRHGRCGYGPYYDYSHSNFLSPLSYVFPANWGPFFACRMYVSPVEPPLPDRYWRQRLPARVITAAAGGASWW
jgi:hypothetical protein